LSSCIYVSIFLFVIYNLNRRSLCKYLRLSFLRRKQVKVFLRRPFSLIHPLMSSFNRLIRSYMISIHLIRSHMWMIRILILRLVINILMRHWHLRVVPFKVFTLDIETVLFMAFSKVLIHFLSAHFTPILTHILHRLMIHVVLLRHLVLIFLIIMILLSWVWKIWLIATKMPWINMGISVMRIWRYHLISISVRCPHHLRVIRKASLLVRIVWGHPWRREIITWVSIPSYLNRVER
jgi:hypothetical protein